MATGFDEAMLRGNIGMFMTCLAKGVDHSTLDFFGRTPMFGLRFCYNASVDDFVKVLCAFIDAGADINHVDTFGNTLLLRSAVDNLGVALVHVGADTTKRALANAAMYGCTGTIDAIIKRRVGREDQFHQRDFDSCLDNAASALSNNATMDDMSGLVKLVVGYGANPNRWSTLHNCVRSNDALVSTLVSLGANTDTLEWDFSRGVLNTPMHRMTDMVYSEVYEALVTPTTDFNAKDSSGATPLMTMMRDSALLNSDDVVMTKFKWLIERGASCLPIDNKGRRVSEMTRCKNSPFKEVIAVKIREENWLKRRWIVLLRARDKIWRRTRSLPKMTLVDDVVRCNVDGVFRHIVTFL